MAGGPNGGNEGNAGSWHPPCPLARELVSVQPGCEGRYCCFSFDRATVLVVPPHAQTVMPSAQVRGHISQQPGTVAPAVTGRRISKRRSPVRHWTERLRG